MLVSFSRNELIYISDKLTLMTSLEDDDDLMAIRGIESSALAPADITLINKIEEAMIRALDGQEGYASVDLDADDLYLIREVALSSARMKSGGVDEPVGINIKIKVRRALMEIKKSEEQAEEDFDSEEIDKELFQLGFSHKLASDPLEELTKDAILEKIRADPPIDDDLI